MKKMVVLIIVFFLPLQAWSFGAVVYDPTNYMQNALAARNSVTQLLNQAKQIQYQLETLKYELKNSKKLEQYYWHDIANLLSKAQNITKQGQSISYAMSNLDAQFQKRYPNYQNANHVDYQQAYRNWNNSTLTTLNNSLLSVGAVSNDLANEEQVIKYFKQQAKGAEGQLQALQVTNLINTEAIQQMQSLKYIVAAQTNAQTAFMAQQVSQASFEEEALAKIVDNMPSDFPVYQENPALGLIKAY